MAIRTLLLSALTAGISLASPLERAAKAVNTTTCNGQTYVYQALAGYGFTPSDARDKFGDTAGGIGSSAAIDQKSWKVDSSGVYTGILWSLPDRGWNTEGTLNYQPRLHKFQITFKPDTVSSSSAPNLQLKYLDTVRFTDPAGTPLTGLDPDLQPPYLSFPGFPELPSATYTGDGFGGNGAGGQRVVGDTEGLVLTDDGFWISDEYGPSIFHFDHSGKMTGAIRPPPAIIPQRNGSDSFNAASPPRYDPNITTTPANPTSGRSNNQGLEGLTASPDRKTLYALMQSALVQEGGRNASTRRLARLLEYDISDASHPVYKAEYVVPLPVFANSTLVAAQSEIYFISPTQFLILARDSGRGHGMDNSLSRYRQIDVFDISNATNIAGNSYDATAAAVASVDGVLASTVVPATYCPWLDFNVNAQLNRFGVHNGGDQDAGLLNEKWESIAIVPVNPPSTTGWKDWHAGSQREFFIFSLSDNDFITQNGFMNGGQLPYADESGYSLDNQALVFKVSLPVA
ncbi:3-phytase [Cladophialophora carrionii]|uniref:3-phytase n=1 Tax=Cladophialophora carrionii TaxID=86049 RepID=A0A1C1C6M5_9EURO|nr:3-phytase [Cladophialophora carrionii]